MVASAAMRVALFSAVFALCLAACGGPKLVPYTPLEEKTELDQKKLLDSTEGVLLDRGYLIDKKDEQALKLTTKVRTLLGSDIAKNKYQYVFEVETSGGTLKIHLKCQVACGSGELSDCGKEAPEKIVAEQKAIADQAKQEAAGK